MSYNGMGVVDSLMEVIHSGGSMEGGYNNIYKPSVSRV